MSASIATDPNAVYKCFVHNYETPSVTEWLQHKVDYIHYETGVSTCIYCRKPVKFNSLVQETADHLIPAKCPKCAPMNEAEPNCELIPQKLPPSKPIKKSFVPVEDLYRDKTNC